MSEILVPKNNTYIELLKYTGLFGIDVNITEYDSETWSIKYNDIDGERVCEAVEIHEGYNMDFPDEVKAKMMHNADVALTAGINYYLDNMAKSYRYEDMKSVRSYAGFESPFQPQALKLAQWSADCWIKAGQLEQEVLNGDRDMPTLNEVIAELPIYED